MTPWWIGRAANSLLILSISLAVGIAWTSPHLIRHALHPPKAQPEDIAAAVDVAARESSAPTVSSATVLRRFQPRRIDTAFQQAFTNAGPLRDFTDLHLDHAGVASVQGVTKARNGSVRDLDQLTGWFFSDDPHHVYGWSGPRGSIGNSLSQRPFRRSAIDPGAPLRILNAAAASGLDPADLTLLRFARNPGGLLTWTASWTPPRGRPELRYAATDGTLIKADEATMPPR